MALTRKLLKSFGLEESVIDSIIEAHAETVDALKKERDDARARADHADELDRQLKEANEKLTKAGDSAKIQEEFDNYKAGIEAEKAAAARKAAARVLLKDKVGIKRESALDLILSAEKLDDYEFSADGTFKDPDAFVQAMKGKHAEWIGEVSITGVPSVNPPAGGGKTKMTREEIYKKDDKGRYVLSTAERQKALAENLTP